MGKTKSRIIKSFAILIAILLLCVGGYLFYDLVVPDEVGENYRKDFESVDGKITFVVDNKKALAGHNNIYDGTLTIDKQEIINIQIGFANNCEMLTSKNQIQIFCGTYFYNPIFNQVSVKLTDVNNAYSKYYKVGDEIIIKSK